MVPASHFTPGVWHDAYVAVPVLIVLAIVVVLAGVVLVAAGRGGEMPAVERTDYFPFEMGPVSATDVVLLRPQMALWGYNQQMVDEALDHIAHSIRERDVRIVALEQLVTDLSRESVPSMPLGSPYAGARHARPEPGQSLPERREAARLELARFKAASLEDGGFEEPGFEAERQEAVGLEADQGEAGLMGAPVADPPEHPGQPKQDAPPWSTGTGWPPEVSHD